jgi:RNA polymerase sigma-70 factor (sigma-E family)
MAVCQSRAGEWASADEAIDALFRDYGLRIARLAYMLTGDTAVAEEIAQEGFLRLWRSWDRLEDADAGYAYLRAAVVNLSRSYLRRRLLEIRHRLARLDEAVVVDVDARLDAVAALTRLPRRQRACIALRFFEDMSEAQAAHALGVSVGTVKSQTSKGLRRLEQLLEEADDAHG